MLYLLKYFIKRLPREGFKSLSVPALAMALVFLINVLGGIKASMEIQYDHIINDTPIYFEVSDGDGAFTDGLVIGESYVSQFTDPDVLWSLEGYVDDVLLKRELHILGEEVPTVYALLWGISSPWQISYIATDYNDGINWYGGVNTAPLEVTNAYPDPDVLVEALEGYTEELDEFYGLVQNEQGYWVQSNMVKPCVVISEDLLEHVRDDGFLQFSVIVKKGPNTWVYEFSYEVVGVIRGPVSELVYVSLMEMVDVRRTTRTVVNQFMSGIYYRLPDDGYIGVGDPLEINIMPDVPFAGNLIGITAPEAHLALASDEANISFYDGYDESIFKGDKNLAVVSEDVLSWAQDGKLNFNVHSKLGAVDVVEADLRIVGTVSGVPEGSVYAPFAVVSALGDQTDGLSAYTELLRAKIRDNRELSEFKQTAFRTFSEVGIFFNPQTFALTIFDGEFYDTTEALMQTIFFIDIATPFVYLISICVGFVASFLLTRRRTNEFAVMRSTGVGKFSIFFTTLFEQALLCAFGVAAGCVVFALTWGYVYYERPLIFLGCYLLGAVFSAGRAAGTDVLRLLKDEEQ